MDESSGSVPASPTYDNPPTSLLVESGESSSTYSLPLHSTDNTDATYETHSYKSKERSASESSSSYYHRRQDGLPPLPPASSTPPSPEVGSESRKSSSKPSSILPQPKPSRNKQKSRDRPKSLGTYKSRGISEIDFFLRNHVTYSTSSPLFLDNDMSARSSRPRVATFTSMDMQRDFGRKVACKLLGDQVVDRPVDTASSEKSTRTTLSIRPLLTDERPIFGLILEEVC